MDVLTDYRLMIAKHRDHLVIPTHHREGAAFHLLKRAELTEDVLVSVPSKKEEGSTFCQFLEMTARNDRVHLPGLGMGVTRIELMLKMVADATVL